MKNKSIVSFETKYSFVKNNLLECKKLLSVKKNKAWHFTEYKNLIEKARIEVGYSINTTNQDIFRSIQDFYLTNF